MSLPDASACEFALAESRETQKYTGYCIIACVPRCVRTPIFIQFGVSYLQREVGKGGRIFSYANHLAPIFFAEYIQLDALPWNWYFCNHFPSVSLIHICSSSFDTFPEKRLPCSQLPLPACAASVSSLCPMSLLPEVQNGITVIPVKSWLSTKVLMIRGACPHQMG